MQFCFGIIAPRDSNCFYLGGDINKLFENKLLRSFLKPLLTSDRLRIIEQKSIFSKLLTNNVESIVNDLSIDLNNFTNFLDWFDNISENQISLDEKIGLIDKFIKNSPRIRINEEQRDSVKITVNSNLKDDLIQIHQKLEI